MVSVIIPVYNGESTIKQQLDALSIQICDEPWELIIVNNGSTDSTAEIVASYQSRIPQLRMISAIEKQNSAYARNVGARDASGQGFIFCDADDVVGEGWLASMASAIKQHDFVAGAIDRIKFYKKPEWRPNFDYPHAKSLGFLPYVSSSNMAVSRFAFETVNGFDEAFRHSHDTELSWRLQLAGFDIFYEPKALVFRRSRSSLYGLGKSISNYSSFYPLLYKLYRSHGMPASSWRKGLGRYKWAIRHLNYPFSNSESKKVLWVRNVGFAWGVLKGSIKYRCLYL